jgi:hypothetical protein
MHRMIAISSLAASLSVFALSARPAEAGERVKPALTMGFAEVIGLTGGVAHLGFYLTPSLDIGFVLDDKTMIITSTGFEFAPENGHWGMTNFLILDRLITEVGSLAITIEPQVGFIHDAAPRPDGGFDHALFPSAGLGFAFVTKRATWIPQVVASVGTKDEGWSIAPTLLYSVGF